MGELKILLADVNALTRLPPSIGGCRSVRILNVASNNLLSLPDEIGNLKELRVLNLANNYLRHLPRTVANLPNLTALWLNDNQKKPLMVLQTDYDDKSQSQILTCFLFPQTGPIFGPVSPTVAAAVMAAAVAANPQNQQQAHQQTNRLTSANTNGPSVVNNEQQVVMFGGTTNGLQHQATLENKRQQPTINKCHSLMDEDDGIDLLQISNTLDKSYQITDNDNQRMVVANGVQSMARY